MEPHPQEGKINFRQAEMNWLGTHREELRQGHAGRWVGIDETGLIGSAPNLKELMELCSAENRDPFVTYVTRPDESIRFYGLVRK